jgi:hypothetical protein
MFQFVNNPELNDAKGGYLCAEEEMYCLYYNIVAEIMQSHY